jgi:hypothetical protein
MRAVASTGSLLNFPRFLPEAENTLLVGYGPDWRAAAQRTPDAHNPKLLEIIENPVAEHSPTPDQPENWLLEMPMKPNSRRSRVFLNRNI